MSHPDRSDITPRLRSLDALRGFDMLWIMGAEAVISQWAGWTHAPPLQTLAAQLEHVPWDGLRAYDLIFPLFMFLSGISLPLSFAARIERGESRSRLWRKILTRAAVLVLLGMIYNGLLSAKPDTPRLASVLGQIGIAWGAAASLQLLVSGTRSRLLVLGALLAGIAALQLLVPVPGHGAGVLTPDGAINTWLDRRLLPGQLYGGSFDPEGLLSILSACSLTIAGGVAGSRLRHSASLTWQTAAKLALAGSASIAMGWLCWHLGYPPIKALWTATFNLLAIGISLVAFAAFFLIIDVFNWHSWSFPLQVIGMNSLTIYFITRLIPFDQPAAILFGRLAAFAGDASPLVIACGILLLKWALLYFFYRNKWFLRV